MTGTPPPDDTEELVITEEDLAPDPGYSSPLGVVESAPISEGPQTRAARGDAAEHESVDDLGLTPAEKFKQTVRARFRERDERRAAVRVAAQARPAIDLDDPDARLPPEIAADIEELAQSATASGYDPHLRMEAALTYMSDPERGSIRKVHQDPRFSQLALSTLENWSRRDKWVERRQRFISTWAKHAYSKMGTVFVHERQADMELLKELQDMSMGRLRSGEDPVPIKSLEGIIGALVRVSARKDEIGKSLVEDMLPPDTGDTGTNSPLVGNVDGASSGVLAEHEVLDALNSILDQRRRAVREAHNIDPDESDTAALAKQQALETVPLIEGRPDDFPVEPDPTNT